MTIDLYPASIYEGDLSPDAFGDEVDDICNEIHEACKGFGTDEQRLLKAIGSCNPETRCKVTLRYKELFDKELKAVMKSECGSRDFGTALQFLAVDPVSAECDMIIRACKGFGTNELLLFSIICGRSNTDIDLLKKKFFDLNTKDLGRYLDAELGGHLEQLVMNVLQGSEEEYDPDFHNEDKMVEDCEQLYKMGQGKWGTDEAGLFKILCACPPEYLKELNMKYAEKYGYTLVKVLEKELSGASEKAAMFMMGMKLNPHQEVAKLIKAACAGFGTDELLLTTCLIRFQGIMKDVMAAHIELYGKTIRDRINDETSGDYKKLLMEIAETGEMGC